MQKELTSSDFQCAEVVNYELPMSYSSYGQPDFETYMHRIGRTGRLGVGLLASANPVVGAVVLLVVQVRSQGRGCEFGL